MRQLKLIVTAACMGASLFSLSACGMLRSLTEAPPARVEPAAGNATRGSGQAGDPQATRRDGRQACVAEGESCRAAGSVCCPGMVCTDTGSGMCISRY